MRTKTIILIALVGFMWGCNDVNPDFEPVIQPVQLEQPFWVTQGESVRLGSEDLILADIEIDGWHPRGFSGPLSTTRFTIGEEEISILHMLKCEYEFVGKETVCERDDAFFNDLDTFSASHSNAEGGTYREVALLENGLKIYVLFIETDPDTSTDDMVRVKGAELLIRKD